MNKNRKIIFAPWSCSNKNYYAFQTWYHPLSKIFKNIITFDPMEVMNLHGHDEMNRMFLEMINKEQPDYVFLWMIIDEFSLDTLMQIKKVSPKTKVLNFCSDDDTIFDSYSIYMSEFVDYFLITHKEYMPRYKNKAFLSLATDTDTFKPLNLEKIYREL